MNVEPWRGMFQLLNAVERCRVALTESPLAFDWGRFEKCPDVQEFVDGGGISPTVPGTLRAFAGLRMQAPIGGFGQACDLYRIALVLEAWLRERTPA